MHQIVDIQLLNIYINQFMCTIFLICVQLFFFAELCRFYQFTIVYVQMYI